MATSTLSQLSFERAMRQVWRDELEQNQISATWVSELAQTVTSNQPRGETYGMLGALGGWQKWAGPITADTLKFWEKSIVPASYHNTMFVRREDWSFDRFGVVRPQVAGLADTGLQFQYKLLTDRIANGTTEVAIDGANFFSTTHNWGGGAQSNLVSVNLNDLPAGVRGTTTNPSAEEAGRLMLRGAREIIGFRNTSHQRKMVSSARFLVMVPLKYAEPFAEAVGQTSYSYGVGNPIPTMSRAGLNFTFSVVVNPLLPDGSSETFETSIAMFRVDSPMKPFILQELKPDGQANALWVEILAEGTEHWIKNHNAMFSARWEGAAANWMWDQAIKLTMTRS